MRLVPGGEDKGARGDHAHNGHHHTKYGSTVGRGFIFLPDPSAPSPGARPNRSTFTNRQDFPTFRPGMIRNHGQGRGRLGLTRRARSGRFWPGAPSKRPKGKQGGLPSPGAMPMILLIGPFSGSGCRVFGRGSIASPTWWKSPQSSAGRKSPAWSCLGFHSSGCAAWP